MKLRPSFVRGAVALVAAAISAIAAAADKDDFEQHAAKVRAGPASAPLSNDTGFSKGLKCMDSLFRAYGVRNVTVVIDTIPDATKKISVGARDMFMSATAQMTRTTHAVRLVPIVESHVFNEARRERVIADADFAIQGSISQFDDSMLKKQRDGAVCIWHLCIGAADSDKIAGLGLDLNLVETGGMSVVPGASVKNAVLIRTHGNGYDGDLILKKFSVEFNFTLVSSEGNGQALRTLIELGAIELYGRMLKLPYWSCLGASDQDSAVSSEIDDWWEEMAGDPRDSARLLGYLQLQMKAQGLYDGQGNGTGSQALLRAVRAYLLALGLPDDVSHLDGRFLRKYLAADHAQVRKIAAANLQDIAQKEGPLPPEPVAQAAPTAPANTTAANTATPPGAPVTQSTPTAQNAPATQGAAIAQNTHTTQNAAPSGPTHQSVQPVVAVPAMSAPTASATSAAAGPAAAAVPASPSASAAPLHPAARDSTAAVQPAAAQSVAAAAATQPVPATGVQRVAFQPAPAAVATIPIKGSRPANNTAYRPGEPFFVGLISPHDGYLYCYLVDDQQRISQFFPTPTQPLARVPGGALKVFPATSDRPLITSRAGRQEEVACFSSPKDLGQQPLEVGDITGGLEPLKSRFAMAASGTFGMGVFNVKVK
jgi:hypothetical protein